jgi:protein phosphatase 2C family protein 2/3
MVYPSQRGVALFGIFDGHGGNAAAKYAERQFPLSFHTFFTNSGTQDHQGRALGIRRGLRMAMEEVDRKFLSETKETAGSTACVAALDVETLVIHVANVGDTRCILCREGRALDLSVDHKANHPAEIARIVESGGFVARGRALGLLAIARALGDRDLKRPGSEASPITAVPDCDSFVLDPSRDEFFLIACDGLFDVMTSQQVVAFVRARLGEGMTEEGAVTALANHAIDTLGSLDNVTVILVGLSWNYIGILNSSASTPRSMRAPTIRRSESATVRAAKASAHKRQTSRMSSTESSTTSLNGLTLSGGT